MFESGKGGAKNALGCMCCRKRDPGPVPLPPFVMGRSGKHYLPCFSMEGAAFEKILPSEMESKNRLGVVGTTERKREIVLKLCTQWC